MTNRWEFRQISTVRIGIMVDCAENKILVEQVDNYHYYDIILSIKRFEKENP